MHALTSVAAAAILAFGVNAQQAYEVAGNWYTNAVDSIQYTNFGVSGTYNKVTSMDSATGTCGSEPFPYSGSTAPLDGQVSVHFRGPLQLNQFAFYSPSSSSKAKRAAEEESKKKKEEKHHKHHKHHKHGHAHAHEKRDAEEEKRQVGAWVTVTMNGQVVSWVNEWSGEPTSAPAPAPTTTENSGNVVTAAVAAVTSAVGHIVSGGSSSDSTGSSDGPYSRSAYYNAQSQTSNGLTFLAHYGGQGSGVFDYTFGNSLSYMAPDAQSGSASPQILANTVVPSDTEYLIMTDQDCDESCGFTRPGGVAKQGFGGDSKIFVFEFSMPSDGKTGFNADMPAIWILNAQIPLTLQYGNAECSCWLTGCGELDIMEVLDSGDSRCTSTFHGSSSSSKGDSAFIQRPTGAPMQLAVVMADNLATIKVLDGSFDFSQGLSQSQVDAWSSPESLLAGLASSIALG